MNGQGINTIKLVVLQLTVPRIAARIGGLV